MLSAVSVAIAGIAVFVLAFVSKLLVAPAHKKGFEWLSGAERLMTYISYGYEKERPPVLHAMIAFDKSLDNAVVIQAFQSIVAGQPRLCKRRGIFMLPLVPSWLFSLLYLEDDPSFDLNRHISFEEADLWFPGDDRKSDAALAAFMQKSLADPLDPAIPLWRVRVVNAPPHATGKGSILLFCFHHSLADGASANILILNLMESVPVTTGTHPRVTADASGATPVVHGGEMHKVEFSHRSGSKGQARATNQSTGLVRIVRAMVGAVLILLRGVHGVWRLTYYQMSLFFIRTNPAESLGPVTPTVPKRVGWTRPLPLSEVKVVREAFSVTVNDVMLACLSGALRRLALANASGASASGTTFRDVMCSIPMSMRREVHRTDPIGNCVSGAWVFLPIACGDAVAVVKSIHERMAYIKTPAIPIFNHHAMKGVGFMPLAIIAAMNNSYFCNGKVALTNVPLPQLSMRFRGTDASMRGIRLFGLLPTLGGICVAVSGCDGTLVASIVADEHLPTASPFQIAEYMEEELRTLVAAARAVR